MKLKTIAVLSILITCMFIACSDQPDTETYKIRSRCAVMSEDFVKQKLQYPQEAEFSTSEAIHEIGEYGECIILGKVTSKNAYGVRTSYIYKIWLFHNGREWNDINNWSYSKLILEDENKKQTVFDNRVKPQNNTTAKILGTVDGIECVFVEGNDSHERITTSTKMTEAQIEKAITELKLDEKKVLFFTLAGKTKRGEEYAQKAGDFIAIYGQELKEPKKNKKNTTKKSLGTIDGIECVFIEGNDSETTIAISEKMTEAQIRKAVKSLNIKTNNVYFYRSEQMILPYGVKNGDVFTMHELHEN